MYCRNRAPAVFVFAAAFLLPLSHAQGTHPWTVQEIYGHEGSLTGDPPEGISWSPDGRVATYLADSGDVMEVFPGDGKPKKMIPYEKISGLLSANVSERDRDHRNRYDEPDYIWAPDSQHLLFDTDGELWVYELKSGTGVQVGNSGMQSGDDPKFSPNGKYISFLRNHNLYLQRPDGSAPATALTKTDDPTLLNGEVDWVYLEELDVRSNYFWSPDSKHIAYLQMNEKQVPQYPIEDWLNVHSAVDEQRYPQPGDPNPGVKVGVVDENGGATHWLKIPEDYGNDYIPRFGWVDPRVVWVETLSRDHKHLNVWFADTKTGEVKLVLAQTEPEYFTETYDLHFLDNDQFLIVSWRDGYRHIYRYAYNPSNPLDAEARPLNQVESGDYEVTDIKAIDLGTSTVYYLAEGGNPLDVQIWAVHLDGSGKRQVSRTPGVHDPDFPENGKAYIDTYSDRMTPPTVASCAPDGTCQPFWQSTPVRGHTLRAPVDLTLTAADGKTELYGAILLPDSRTAVKSVPLLVNPYGGPGVGEMTNRWRGKGFFFDQLLAEHGFAVLHVDNRGMAGRGRAFEQACYHNFGPPQLADQLSAIDQVLAKYPQLDPERMGWWGWSWGGSFTLYAMSHSDRFQAGVSGAPVTDFRNYDSIYTERYLGLPAEDKENYDRDSDLNSADDLKGHLLILHGTGDDNVHLENTVQYIERLIQAGIPYDYNIFPRKTHSVAGAKDQTELFSKILEHFERYFAQAPANRGTGAQGQ
ncbi:alpha/beta fold hydrolase [Paracidobacterium acidisoli]|uniref:alpha/beta fold hydrolase n=1 Tax=Paracidobacterium acidisoli TaxID=2303751 RepID=UPI0020797CA0|nr:alpha/beta fold hydrolase [Paracidobacterium acidisoli]